MGKPVVGVSERFEEYVIDGITVWKSNSVNPALPDLVAPWAPKDCKGRWGLRDLLEFPGAAGLTPRSSPKSLSNWLVRN